MNLLYLMRNPVKTFALALITTGVLFGSSSIPSENSVMTSVSLSAEVVDDEKEFHEYIVPIGDLLSRGEGDWNSVNRGWAGDTPGGIVGLTGKSFEDYTVGQVIDMQRRWLYAVGRYQFVPKTLRFAVANSDVTLKDKFDSQTQNKLLGALLIHKRPSIGNYLKGHHGSINRALRALAKEWASVEYLGYGRGRGYYNHIGGNRAHITVSEASSVLSQVRREILNT